MTTLNVQAGEEENSSDEDIEALDNPDIYFGEKAKDKFWDFYKSERRFKDFNLHYMGTKNRLLFNG